MEHPRKMSRAFPKDISDNPSPEELAHYLADMLEWLVRARLADLLKAGFTDVDLFSLRRIAKDYRSSTQTHETYQYLRSALKKLKAAGLLA